MGPTRFTHTDGQTDIQTDGDHIKRVVHGPLGDHTLKNTAVSGQTEATLSAAENNDSQFCCRHGDKNPEPLTLANRAFSSRGNFPLHLRRVLVDQEVVEAITAQLIRITIHTNRTSPQTPCPPKPRRRPTKLFRQKLL